QRARTQFGGGLPGGRQVNIRDHYLRPGSVHRGGNRPANATRRAGANGGFVAQKYVHMSIRVAPVSINLDKFEMLDVRELLRRAYHPVLTYITIIAYTRIKSLLRCQRFQITRHD